MLRQRWTSPVKTVLLSRHSKLAHRVSGLGAHSNSDNVLAVNMMERETLKACVRSPQQAACETEVPHATLL